MSGWNLLLTDGVGLALGGEPESGSISRPPHVVHLQDLTTRTAPLLLRSVVLPVRLRVEQLPGCLHNRVVQARQ